MVFFFAHKKLQEGKKASQRKESVWQLCLEEALLGKVGKPGKVEEPARVNQVDGTNAHV